MEQELELSAVIGFQGKFFNLKRKVPLYYQSKIKHRISSLFLIQQI